LGRWSNDGSALLTGTFCLRFYKLFISNNIILIAAGQDGAIKIWSRNGMLRSTLVKANLPILTANWSPDSSSILYAQGANLILQSLNSNSKPYKVKYFSMQEKFKVNIFGHQE